MPKAVVGLVAGVLMGGLHAVIWFTRPEVRSIAMSLFLAEIVKGGVTGATAGIVAARTRRFSPALLAGVGGGIAYTLLAWIASHNTGRPPILPAIAVGGVSALAAWRWGR